MKQVAALVLLAPVLMAPGMRYPTRAQYENPADCPDNYGSTVCDDATINTALDAFPYWDYWGWVPGVNGAVMFAGARGGRLYAQRCDHCSVLMSEVCFTHGTYKGQCYDLDGSVTEAVSGILWGEYVQQSGGEPVPDLPFVKVLHPSELRGIGEGKLLLRVGAGIVGQHLTSAIFEECATTIENGNPGTSCDGNGENCTVDACCDAGPHPYGVTYSDTTSICGVTPISLANTCRQTGGTCAPWCWGAPGLLDGTASECGPAGADLTIIAPEPIGAATYAGGGNPADASSLHVYRWALDYTFPTPSALNNPWDGQGTDAHWTHDGAVESMLSAGCPVVVQGTSEWTPNFDDPGEKLFRECALTQTSSGYQRFTDVTSNDSSAEDFVWLGGEWFWLDPEVVRNYSEYLAITDQQTNAAGGGVQ